MKGACLIGTVVLLSYKYSIATVSENKGTTKIYELKIKVDGEK
jgi:hypothetical protein